VQEAKEAQASGLRKAGEEKVQEVKLTREQWEYGGRYLVVLGITGALGWLLEYYWIPAFCLGFFILFIAPQWPSKRIRNQRVKVAMGFDAPRDGTVLALDRSSYRPAATVHLDGEKYPIKVPLDTLTFSWRSRLTRLLPKRFRA
jgi:hypothetical protein